MRTCNKIKIPTCLTVLIFLSILLSNSALYSAEPPTGDPWLDAPRLKVVAIKHWPGDDNEYGDDPTIFFPYIVQKVRNALEQHPDADLVVLPENILAKSVTEGSWPDYVVTAPIVGFSCDVNGICNAYAAEDNFITQGVLDTLESLQQLASIYHVQILAGTVNERFPVPPDMVEIPGDSLIFDSLVVINDQGEITGTRKKQDILDRIMYPYFEVDEVGDCDTLLAPGEDPLEIINQDDHPFTLCKKSVEEFTYENLYHTVTLDDGTLVNYMVIICGEFGYDGIIARAQEDGMQNMDILIDSLQEGDWGWEQKMHDIQLGNWDENSDSKNATWPVLNAFYDPFVKDSGVIKTGGYIVAADSVNYQNIAGEGQGAVIQLNESPRPIPVYEINRDYIYGEIPIIKQPANLDITNDTQSAGQIKVNSELLSQNPWHTTATKETYFTLAALPNPGYMFEGWTGDTQFLEDPLSCQTKLTLSDNTGLHASFSNQITNTPPVMEPIGDIVFDTTISNQRVTYQINVSDKDCGPQALSYYAHGLPAGMFLDSETGIISFPASQTGYFSGIRIFATDGMDTVSRQATITNVNMNNLPSGLPADCNCDGQSGSGIPDYKDLISQLQVQSGLMPSCAWCCEANNQCPEMIEEQSDTTEPVIMTHYTFYAPGSNTLFFNIATDEIAACKYSDIGGQNYDDMQLTFEFSNSTNHMGSFTHDGSPMNIYIRCQDLSGNSNLNDYVINFPEIRDYEPPTGQVAINGLNATKTNNPSVSLMLSASDTYNAVTKMKISNYDQLDWRDVSEEDYAVSKNWMLESGDGTKNVWVKFEDSYGNWSDVVTNSIILDTTEAGIVNGLPTGSMSPELNTVTLSVTTDEPATCKYDTLPGRAYDAMRYTFSATGGTQHSRTISNLINNGMQYNYYVRCEDSAGNVNDSDYHINFTVPLANQITPGRVTVSSGQTANMTFSVYVDPVGTKMYMYCPYGLTIGLNAQSNICNRWVNLNLPQGDTVMPFKVKNSTSKVLNAAPNFYVYKQSRPNYSIGVSGAITVNAGVSSSPSPSPSPSPSMSPSPRPSPSP